MVDFPSSSLKCLSLSQNFHFFFLLVTSATCAVEGCLQGMKGFNEDFCGIFTIKEVNQAFFIVAFLLKLQRKYKIVKLTQTILWLLPTNCLSVFDHFGMLVMGLMETRISK